MVSDLRLATKIAASVAMPIPFQHIILTQDSFLFYKSHKDFDFFRNLCPPHPTVTEPPRRGDSSSRISLSDSR
jgi:hypothetical protein